MKFWLIPILLVLMSGMVSLSQTTTAFPQPFTIDIDPMERLLLINIEKDPDSLYVGFEPQVFNDTVNGEGHLVIGWRVDGKVDVYHQPGLKLNPGKYDIAGKGLANLVQTNFKTAFFEVNNFGVQAHYLFADLHERTIQLAVKESNPKPRSPFGLLAPMGSVAEAPSSMPLILLHDFYFVRQKHTEITIMVNGQKHEPDRLPMSIDGTKMYFTRYCPDPLIATFNPKQDGLLPVIDIVPGQQSNTQGNYEYSIVWENNTPSIQKLTRKHTKHPIELRFKPAFPNIATLPNQTLFEGYFEIEGDYSTGRIGGYYLISKTNGETTIELVPSKGWIPRPNKLSLRFLYTVGKVFKQWPTTYRWNAVITKNDGNLHIKSEWKRD